jgi:transposase
MFLRVQLLKGSIEVTPLGKRGRKKQSKPKNLIDHCILFKREILSFMHNFSIPFSDNQAERDIRWVNLQQKISGIIQSEDKATVFCRIRGYLSTVKKNERPILASLVGSFQGNPFTPTYAHRTG